MDTPKSLVLVVGDEFNFYASHTLKDYQTVRIQDHVVDQKTFRLLRHANVAVVGEHGQRKQRQGIVHQIRKWMPSCRIDCHVVHPLGGPMQHLWCGRWMLAERSPSTARPNGRNDGDTMPDIDEGFDAIRNVWTPLVAHDAPFRNEGLVISAAAVCTFKDQKVHVHPAAKRLMEAWMRMRSPRRRVIVFLTDRQGFCRRYGLKHAVGDRVRRLITDALQSAAATVPVHVIEYLVAPASNTTDPRVLSPFKAAACLWAYIHRRFKLDLDRCLYVDRAAHDPRGTCEHDALARSLGLVRAQAPDLLEHFSHSVVRLDGDWTAPLSRVVHDHRYARPAFLGQVALGATGRTVPDVPGLSELRESDGCLAESTCSGPITTKTHGLLQESVHEALLLLQEHRSEWLQVYGPSPEIPELRSASAGVPPRVRVEDVEPVDAGMHRDLGRHSAAAWPVEAHTAVGTRHPLTLIPHDALLPPSYGRPHPAPHTASPSVNTRLTSTDTRSVQDAGRGSGCVQTPPRGGPASSPGARRPDPTLHFILSPRPPSRSPHSPPRKAARHDPADEAAGDDETCRALFDKGPPDPGGNADADRTGPPKGEPGAGGTLRPVVRGQGPGLQARGGGKPGPERSAAPKARLSLLEDDNAEELSVWQQDRHRAS